jgi:hypothetical protein
MANLNSGAARMMTEARAGRMETFLKPKAVVDSRMRF